MQEHIRKGTTEGTICSDPHWPAQHFKCIFTSVYISVGFRKVPFKQHKKNRKAERCPPFLWQQLCCQSCVLGKGNISDKVCSDGTYNHNKVCLNNITSTLGLSLPQRCTAGSSGNLSSEVCTMGSQQRWKSCCNPATNAPSCALCLTIMSCLLQWSTLLPALYNASNPMGTHKSPKCPFITPHFKPIYVLFAWRWIHHSCL